MTWRHFIGLSAFGLVVAAFLDDPLRVPIVIGSLFFVAVSAFSQLWTYPRHRRQNVKVVRPRRAQRA